MRSLRDSLSAFVRTLSKKLKRLRPLERQQLHLLLLRVRAYRVVHAGVTASLRATSNNRVYFALFLLLIAAPLSDVAYQGLAHIHPLFAKWWPTISWYEGQHWFDDHGNRIHGWYYENFYWLFYQLGPHLQDLVLLTAAFFLMREKDDTRWLLAIATGWPVSKILWAIQITSNAEIHQFVPMSFLVVGVLVGFFWIFCFDYLMTLHYHKREGHRIRAKSILASEAFTDAQARVKARNELEMLEALN